MNIRPSMHVTRRQFLAAASAAPVPEVTTDMSFPVPTRIRRTALADPALRGVMETLDAVAPTRATVLLDQAIRAGDVEVGVGGGMESMSQAPYLLPGARQGFRMGEVKALDAMVSDGLTNPFSGRQMFDEATEIGDELEITRPDLDRWALRYGVYRVLPALAAAP